MSAFIVIRIYGDLAINYNYVKRLRYSYNWNFSDNGNITRLDQVIRFPDDVVLAVF